MTIRLMQVLLFLNYYMKEHICTACALRCNEINKKVTTSTLRCKVTGEGNAQSIAPEFSGRYLLVECHATTQGQPDSSSKEAWLQDFNVFVPVAQQSGDKPEGRVKLENVSVIR